MTRRAGICLQWLVLTGAGHFFAAGVWARNYPVKVVRYIVPMSPGAGSDTIGRIMAAGMAEVFGQ
jgi:tripartite-type tricarboxylate transporter receptor subunit TctC